MINKKTQFITRTAMMIAVVVVIQMVGRMLPYNNFIVGPLVNACLIVSAAMMGLWGGAIVAVVSPFTSLINNHAPIAGVLLFFAPFIAAGNLIFVLGYHLLRKKSVIAGLGIGALMKFGFLYAAIILFIKNFSIPNIDKFSKPLLALFGWSQLVTAVVGGIVAIIVIKALGSRMEWDSNRDD